MWHDPRPTTHDPPCMQAPACKTTSHTVSSGMATRESLLDVTARLYSEHGWRGTTTRAIAAAAGVNEVTLFRQFGSKELLLNEAICAAVSDSTPTLPDVPGDLAQELL